MSATAENCTPSVIEPQPIENNASFQPPVAEKSADKTEKTTSSSSTGQARLEGREETKKSRDRSPQRESDKIRTDRERDRDHRNRQHQREREPEKPAFKIVHAGTGSWQHLKYEKPAPTPYESVADEKTISERENTEAQQNVVGSEPVVPDPNAQPISSYPPKPNENLPDNDYFLSQHAKYNEETQQTETTITIQCNASKQFQNQSQNGFQPPLPPPLPEEEQQMSENFDLLLGFGMDEDAAKKVDLLFTCNYLTEPLPDDLILELAELDFEKVAALVESFKSADLSKIRNRLVFFKARLKLIKMKGISALPVKNSSSANGVSRLIGYRQDPQAVNSHQGGFIHSGVAENVSGQSTGLSNIQSEAQKIVSQVAQNSSTVGIAQSQTYTYMAMQKLAQGGAQSNTQNPLPAQNVQSQQIPPPQGAQISAAPVMNTVQNGVGQQMQQADPNSIAASAAAASYNYPPNPYQDMTSVAQGQTGQYPGTTQYPAGQYPGYNYYGSYTASYGWGSSATPTNAGGDAGAKSYTGLGYNSSNVPAYSGPGYRTGPDMSKMNEILLRTGYNYEHNHVIRKYGPPPDWVGDPPASGHELFVGKIPTDCWEDEVIPIFEQIGKIYEVKILIDKETNLNKGFCFVCMCTKDDAKKAISRLNGSYIRQRCRIFVKYSVQFTRLFVGGIPRNKSREEIFSAFHDEVHNLSDVEVLGGDDGMQNRGFAFLDFKTYFDAAVARLDLFKMHVAVF